MENDNQFLNKKTIIFLCSNYFILYHINNLPLRRHFSFNLVNSNGFYSPFNPKNKAAVFQQI